jgi:ribosome-binding protein aMBF1 (putative translation factor)
VRSLRPALERKYRPSLGDISPEQCRAARAWLGWTQLHLAKKSRIGLSTIKAYEGGAITTRSTTTTLLAHTFQREGVLFLFDQETDAPFGLFVGRPTEEY